MDMVWCAHSLSVISFTWKRIVSCLFSSCGFRPNTFESRDLLDDEGPRDLSNATSERAESPPPLRTLSQVPLWCSPLPEEKSLVPSQTCSSVRDGVGVVAQIGQSTLSPRRSDTKPTSRGNPIVRLDCNPARTGTRAASPSRSSHAYLMVQKAGQEYDVRETP